MIKDFICNPFKRIESIVKYFLCFLSMILLFITCNEDVEVQDELKDAPKLTFSKLTVDKKESYQRTTFTTNPRKRKRRLYHQKYCY